MKVVISSGHGKYIRGASGAPVPPQLDEVDEARKVVDQTAVVLRGMGVDVTTFHDNTSHDQSTNLNTIVNFHNKQGPHDLDVSVHFNAYGGGANGCEVDYLTQKTLSQRVAGAICTASGLKKRGDNGAVYRDGLAFLNNTNAPAILIETCFCDYTPDCDKYRESFADICTAIAEGITGEEVIPGPQPEPEPEPDPDDDLPVLRKGDEGLFVSKLQSDLNDQLAGCRLVVDGDFGSATDSAVRDYQYSRALAVDGIVGPQTWEALETEAPFVPPPPSLISLEDQQAIRAIASNSKIQQYNWPDRGIMPPGYCQGMALAFAVSYLQLLDEVSWSVEMAKANTHNSDKDALSWYAGKFKEAGMSIDKNGPDTLRALWSLMLGLGMRESSGRYCCGRDTSAGSSSQSSDTCEAGTFQQSWNSASSTKEMQNLMDAYDSDTSNCYVDTWKQGVSCSSSEWECVGSGNGYKFQEMCKECPTYCAQSCAVGLRNIRQHWGPINRYEAEVKSDAGKMFKDVQDYVDGLGAFA
jgi:N-acetylmuramoyl-L-alanine amidase/Putative peptidoglycan binding domain